jgi:ADP-ribose pyrophosphatase YjhB (NUDIX family)
MNQGVRAAVIATKDQSILLVRHVHPVTAEEWWVPPGGALEDRDDSIQTCAAREVAEETGLIPVVGRLVYVREFREANRNTRWVELYFLADELGGILTAEHLTEERPGEKYIREARWLARNELDQRNVFPEILRDQFWSDLKAGFPQVRYLGLSRG